MKTKKKLRSILSYRPVENREVILASEALDYVKKQGYIVLPLRKGTLTVLSISLVWLSIANQWGLFL